MTEPERVMYPRGLCRNSQPSRPHSQPHTPISAMWPGESPVTRHGESTLCCNFKNTFSPSGWCYNHSLRHWKLDWKSNSKTISGLKTVGASSDSLSLSGCCETEQSCCLSPLFPSFCLIPHFSALSAFYKVIVRTKKIMFTKCLKSLQRKLIIQNTIVFWNVTFQCSANPLTTSFEVKRSGDGWWW